MKEQIKKICKYLVNLCSNNSKFFIWLLFTNASTMTWSLFQKGENYTACAYMGMMWIICLIATAIIAFIPIKIVRVIIQFILLAPMTVFMCAEMVTMNQYNSLIGTGILNSIMETNPREAREFLRTAVGWQEFFEVIIIAIVVILIYRNRHRFTWFYSNKIKSFFRYFIPIITAISLFLTIDLVAVYPNFVTDPFVPTWRIAHSAKSAYHNMIAYHKLTRDVNDKVVLTANNSKIPNIVFILGEATNRNHMHLYGYNLPTTPNLDKLNAEGQIAVFRDVISPHSTTIAVLSELFTFAHYETNKPWYKYNNLIDIMKAAGYKTFWLSNQESSGIWGNVAQVYASHSDYHKFTRIRDSREDFGIVDGALFPLIDHAKTLAAPNKNFYVIHLMGCHIAYYNRYPYAFAKFSAKDIKLNLPEDKREVIAQYDNAVYYNDYVVNTIINKFKDENVLVIYVPDHAESVYDDGSNITGHVDENATHNMIEIPVIMWASPKFKAEFPGKWEQIKDSVERPYMTDDMINTVLDLADIKTANYDPTRSLVNDKFNPNRKRIFNGKNYDLEIKQGIRR